MNKKDFIAGMVLANQPCGIEEIRKCIDNAVLAASELEKAGVFDECEPEEEEKEEPVRLTAVRILDDEKAMEVMDKALYDVISDSNTRYYSRYSVTHICSFLRNIGINTVLEFSRSKYTKRELLKNHSIGYKSVSVLKDALYENGIELI